MRTLRIYENVVLLFTFADEGTLSRSEADESTFELNDDATQAGIRILFGGMNVTFPLGTIVSSTQNIHVL